MAASRRQRRRELEQRRPVGLGVQPHPPNATVERHASADPVYWRELAINFWRD
jgi:hypothetical protein